MTKVLLPLFLLAAILGGAALVHPTTATPNEPARVSETEPTPPTEPTPVEPTLPTQPNEPEPGVRG